MPVLPEVGSTMVSPGLDSAVSFRRALDHRETDAILDAARPGL